MREEPIRVLCVVSTLGRGGAESMIMNLFRHLDRSKVVFDFVKHTKEIGDFEDEIKTLGGQIYSAPRYKLYNHLSYVHWWSLFLAAHPEYQIIRGHFFTISTVFFRVAKKYERITVAHCHATKAPDVAVQNRFKQWVHDRMVLSAEQFSDYCLACSEEAGKWMFRKKPFIVLNNAINAKSFQYKKEVAEEVRQTLNLGNSFVIGTVGRFNLQKNPLGIVDIFYRIQLRRPDSKLIWVGDGPMRKDAEGKTRSLGLVDKVMFLGVRSDVPRLLQAMDVFVFPSFYEGLGVALVEAQAAGVESFCSDVVPEEAGVTDLCHFLPLDDYGRWAEEICKIPAKRPHSDMKEQIIKANYDIHTTAQWLQEFYLSISEI